MRMMGGSRSGGRQRPGQGPGQDRPDRNGEPVIVMRNLWYINNEGKPEVTRVRTGISSGSFTAIYSREDMEGKQVILREKI